MCSSRGLGIKTQAVGGTLWHVVFIYPLTNSPTPSVWVVWKGGGLGNLEQNDLGSRDLISLKHLNKDCILQRRYFITLSVRG